MEPIGSHENDDSREPFEVPSVPGRDSRNKIAPVAYLLAGAAAAGSAVAMVSAFWTFVSEKSPYLVAFGATVAGVAAMSKWLTPRRFALRGWSLFVTLVFCVSFTAVTGARDLTQKWGVGANTLDTPLNYTLVAGDVRMCLDGDISVMTDQAVQRVQGFKCNGANQQVWTTDDGGLIANYFFQSLCLDAGAANPSPSTKLYLRPCDVASKSQRWRAESDGSIRLRSGGLCMALDPLGYGVNGAPVALVECNGSESQRWTIREAVGDK